MLVYQRVAPTPPAPPPLPGLQPSAQLRGFLLQRLGRHGRVLRLRGRRGLQRFALCALTDFGGAGWGACGACGACGAWRFGGIPSGKLTKNYGKSPFSMGKSTINGHFQ